MREIKFRAWNLTDKCWDILRNVYSINGEIEGTGGLFSRKDQIVRFNRGDIVLMQFTGLKDKNGKEIYEGDIVIDDWYPSEPHPIEEPLEGKYRVEYMAPSWRCQLIGGNPEDNESFDDFSEMEVIGNIYENSNL